MSMAEGVIVAKARSMHGEALDEEMYQELLHKKSVAEIAGYLKHETSYAAALKDVRENNIHRGQLESIPGNPETQIPAFSSAAMSLPRIRKSLKVR